MPVPATTPPRPLCAPTPTRRLAWLAVGILGGVAGCSQPVFPPAPVMQPPPPPPPPPPQTAAELGGIVAGVAGDGFAVVDVRLPLAGFEAALFRGDRPAIDFTAAPVQGPLTGTRVAVPGLSNQIDQYFGLGVRATGTTSWTPVGVVVRLRPGAPIHVDSMASAQGADGMSPATAFPDLHLALALASFTGQTNVWVRMGAYGFGPYLLPPGVGVYGGFEAGFDPADRRPDADGTVFGAPPGLTVVQVFAGPPACTLDGLLVEGAGNSALVGIDVSDSPVELRSVRVQGFLDRGCRLRSSAAPVAVSVTASVFHGNGADGLSASGAFDLVIDGSTFTSNVQEGMDVDDLVAREGESASLRVSASRFAGNGAEGLDVDLAAPALPGPGGGRFAVTISGSSFDANGDDGLLLDLEYELAPGWSGDYLVSACTARDNGRAGVHVDADAPGSLLLHRIRSTANRGAGIAVTSESDAGFALVSSSVALGNLGAGIHASLGNRAVLATHCVVAGNFGGGVVSDTVRSAVTSSLFRLQTEPTRGAVTFASVEAPDPQLPALLRAPNAFARVLAFGSGQLTVEGAIPAPTAVVELADDAVARAVTAVQGSGVTVTPTPARVVVPTVLWTFPAGPSVREDFRLAIGSVAVGAGLTPPGGMPVDCGVWGAPLPGVPGFEDGVPRTLLRPVSTAPVLTAAVAAMQPVDVVFNEPLDGTSVAGQVRAVSETGQPLGIAVQVAGDRLTVTPPAGGWPQPGFSLELYAGLLSAAGAPLATPLVIPFRSP